MKSESKDNIAISVSHVSKHFKLPKDNQNSLKGKLINFNKRGYTIQQTLKDVSFEVKKGEFLGIVGRNGSGKSTLLKLISGIYAPTSGNINHDGRLTPFIELGVGFSPELSGRDNVFLNGALLGFTRGEMHAMYDEIVEFAELEGFMDQKLKNYSSGMQVRLAFSIAIKVNTDILVLDEVLAVGDAAFQQKCFDYFMDLKRKKKTVILVTHDMGAVKQYCDRAIMIEAGRVVAEGTPEKVSSEYQKLFIQELEEQNGRTHKGEDHWGTGQVQVLDTKVEVNEKFVTVKTQYEIKENVKDPVFGFSIYTQADIGLIDANTFQVNKKSGDLTAGEIINMTWHVPNLFTKGKYRISTGCASSSFHKIYDQVMNAAEFRISTETPTGGIIFPNVTLDNFTIKEINK
jgi:ABC-2 type transport system ATP-binding protein